ncbi:serine hydrolase [Enterococcus ureasiticus]|uniref:Beta-lactamase-related domain-containing protein n=1 Tax=Enterococcus ureasiticus TaxID=903984 RepID=A0A1E5GFC3_9ENTE|nr:serine hydrolase [Enterococcus ureasiticus]OEG11357.1 hypothetical protein BCR21_08645 [Enterococcus ureasiticus]
MHQKRHHKKSNPLVPLTVVFILMILVGLEIYLLFFNNNTALLSQKHEKNSTVRTGQQTTKLTNDAQQVKNFNQEVQPTSNLAKQLNQKLEDGQFIGTALMIKNGQIILQKGFGYANFEKKQPNTYQSLFQIGSIQKSMTATLILQQVQSGKLSLDETLERFYPNIQDSQEITIRQLLSMCSGLYQKSKPETMMTDEAFLQYGISNAIMGTYGKFRYDATNYYLLVGILEQLTGTSYHTLFNQTFIQKLQLSHTCFYNDFLHSNERTFPYEKKEDNNYKTKVADKPILFNREIGTGSIGMTVGDLYLFFSHFLSGSMINKNTFDSFWTPKTLEKFAGGIYMYQDYIRAHGVEEGFETNSYISKDKQNAVILFTNQYPKNQSYTLLGKEVFDLLVT